jgi:hypothetical protein
LQGTTQLAAKNTRPVSFPSQAGAKGYIIYAIVAPAIFGASDLPAVGRRKEVKEHELFSEDLLQTTWLLPGNNK